VVRAEVEVTRVRGGRVQFATRVVKEDGGDVALDGDAMAMIRRS
jgi:acyl-CoA thioesterase FadM